MTDRRLREKKKNVNERLETKEKNDLKGGFELRNWVHLQHV